VGSRGGAPGGVRGHINVVMQPQVGESNIGIPDAKSSEMGVWAGASSRR